MNKELIIRKAQIDGMITAILEMGYIPEILVNALDPNAQINVDHCEPNGSIMFNVSPNGVRDYRFDTDGMSFSYSRGGVPHTAYVPLGAIMVVVAREDRSMSMLLSPLAETEQVEHRTTLRAANDSDVQGKAPIGSSDWKLHSV